MRLSPRVLHHTVATLAALGLVIMLRGPAAAQGADNPAATPTPRTADGKPDLNGRWGSSAGGGRVQAIEPDGTEVDFDTFAAYQAALASGEVSRSEIGRAHV